ncbi:MAG: formate dehydrogenase subunit gamma [Burkholderiales bacterium]|nr:formate dehydrogenase subunit gamma [Burkholderiales bacterium]MDP2400114.1 formate dehydrogenase subunit gamma [Burkholderiales bacterium]MDP3715151.1 formate dehydrogenase subunit gamma [Burkholderiales bacterium]
MQAVLKQWLVAATCALFVVLSFPAVAADTSSAQEQAARQQVQPGNNAPMWRDVRSGNNPYQTTQVRGVETEVLMLPAGETWRQLRNGPITIYGGWLIVAVMIIIGAYYSLKGPVKLHEKPTGRKLLRFGAWDRMVHWSAAISFVLLAVTGIVILFGKHILLPVFGYSLFSWLATASKFIHNFVGPVFAFCTILMFLTFVKDNLLKRHDLQWFAKGGGLLTGEHVPSGRFNAGEKAWFWVGVTLLGVVVSVTGFVLNFPNFEQGRELMQQMNVIHAIAAIVFMTLSLGHIYMGTLGVEGAYESMRTGYVDEVWAKEHHEYWYREVVAGHKGGGGTASPAVASSMKEGWRA